MPDQVELLEVVGADVELGVGLAVLPKTTTRPPARTQATLDCQVPAESIDEVDAAAAALDDLLLPAVGAVVEAGLGAELDGSARSCLPSPR